VLLNTSVSETEQKIYSPDFIFDKLAKEKTLLGFGEIRRVKFSSVRDFDNWRFTIKARGDALTPDYWVGGI
jgi:hypothetical protein